MTIQLSAQGSIELSGDCPVEDADALLQHLGAHSDARVTWGTCDSMHAAVLQVLLVAKAVPAGTPNNAFLRNKIAPLLIRAK